MKENLPPDFKEFDFGKYLINKDSIDSEADLPEEIALVHAATFLVSPSFAGPVTNPGDIEEASRTFSQEILARALSPKKAEERVMLYINHIKYFILLRDTIKANMSPSDLDFSQQQENLNTLALNIQAFQFIIVPEMAVEMLKIKKESPYRNGLPGLELE